MGELPPQMSYHLTGGRRDDALVPSLPLRDTLCPEWVEDRYSTNGNFGWKAAKRNVKGQEWAGP